MAKIFDLTEGHHHPTTCRRKLGTMSPTHRPRDIQCLTILPYLTLASIYSAVVFHTKTRCLIRTLLNQKRSATCFMWAWIWMKQTHGSIELSQARDWARRHSTATERLHNYSNFMDLYDHYTQTTTRCSLFIINRHSTCSRR